MQLTKTDIIASLDSMKMALEQMGHRISSSNERTIQTTSGLVFQRANKESAWEVRGSIDTKHLKIQIGRAKVFEVAKQQGYMLIREQDEQGRIVIRLRGK